MSVYIPNISLYNVFPDSCVECPCYDDEFGQCRATKEHRHVFLDKPDWCPAVVVPDHGRLVDADKIIKIMQEEKKRIAETYGDDDEFVRCLEKYAISIVLSAETIIQPDKEDVDK